MKKGNLVKEDDESLRDGRIGIIMLVEPMNQYSEYWCRVLWLDGQLTWETSQYLEVIA